jgi:hypothetical protein
MSDDTLGIVTADGPPQRFDVTYRLSPHNRLEIFVDHPALVEGRSTVGEGASLPPGGLVGEVCLEIEEVR